MLLTYPANQQTVSSRIISAVGHLAAYRLFEYYGGVVVKIPKGTGKSGVLIARLIELLGEDGYKRLVSLVGGQKITIPKNKAAFLIARNGQIVADYNADIPIRVLVKRYDLCERQIRSILGRTVE